ncbi:penicillin-binding protein 1B [Reinekea thalattae]|uniref:Penicillin-binding protein 1B n=1 Tax=Reinekea thalattae TaxID=2593301 RepID=A0A5C8Z9U6_9GAMM|nr:penicillin-binding protein 1B [Reinekea thalattae]TXR54164.1 penicillin-binding protein 1B [Reinekea thalattae]
MTKKNTTTQSSRSASARSSKKPQPKRSTRKAKKASTGRFARVAKLFMQLSLIGFCLLIFWMIYLNALVREGFEGRRFQVPARVYSEAQELYAGAPVRQQTLVDLLDQLGYLQSSSVSQPGRYHQQGSTILLYSRGFDFWDGPEPSQKLLIRFNSQGVQSVSNMAGKAVLLTRLDPLYLGQIYPGVVEDRLLYKLEDLPERLVLGLVLVEDNRFFEHWGISFRGIARALFANLTSGSTQQGGSTLTNQLVKNMYLTPEKTIIRKVNEALMSIILEFHYGKNEILETYMNEVYIGQQGARSINGFGLAAQFFYGTTIEGLSIQQQAMLVGLIKGPSYYNPRRNPERAKVRRNVVLKVWHEQQLISDYEYRIAVNAPLGVTDKPGQANFPAFMEALRVQLQRDYRKDDLLAEGLRIYTTLDPVAQETLELNVHASVSEAERNYRIESGSLQAAAVMTRPSTADVLAMTGNRYAKETGFNRALHAYRPVGSLMKPAVYIAALENGYSLASNIDDSDVSVATREGDIWQPLNYDKQSHGSPMLINALAKSYNQATARLGMQVGLVNVFDVIERLGVEGDVPLVPSVMLGAHEMSPMQVAQMYQTISGNGFYSPLNFIRAVSHPDRGVIQRFDLKVDQRFSADVSYLIQTALHEGTLTGTSARIGRELPSYWWAAGKTGTTDGNRDAWYAGFTGDRQLVVWVGRDDNEETPLVGSTGALPIWMRVMKELQPIQERRSVPSSIKYLTVNESGINVPERCDNTISLPFINGTEPEKSNRCRSENETQQEASEKSWWQKVFD